MIFYLSYPSKEPLYPSDFRKVTSLPENSKDYREIEEPVAKVKAVADHITVTNEKHAIAKIISELESGNCQYKRVKKR